MSNVALPLNTSTSWRRPATLGYFLIVITFFVMGGWAAYARIDAAVVATGTITVETNRKTVQHFEGGIIREILVREGQRVDQGSVLFRLDPTQANANAEIVRNQLDAFLAITARLTAEQAQSETISFPVELIERREFPQVGRAIAEQEQQFRERRASLQGQVDILEARVRQLQREIEGLTVERESTTRQVEKIKQELVGLRFLLQRELVQITRVFALEREEARLEGAIGRSTADLAKAETSIGETRLQIRQLQQKFQEDVSTALVENRQRVIELRERLTVAQDVFRRLEVLAPISGVVQNLKVFTLSAVIRPGEPLLDVVPEDAELIIQAQVQPIDSSNIREGLTAEVRLTAFPMWRMPIILGRVKSVSRDRLIDDATRQPFFLAQIVVDTKDIPADLRSRITAGMPADVVIPTGERTALNYIMTPLFDRLRKSMREQ